MNIKSLPILLASFIFSILVVMAEQSLAQTRNFQNYNTEQGLIQSQALCVTQGNNNNLWIGTLGGLSIFDGSTFSNYNRVDGLANNAIYAIDFLANGTAYLATAKGISTFDGLEFKNYPAIKAFENSPINHLVIDNRDRAWILANNKLYRATLPQFTLFSEKLSLSIQKNPSGILHSLFYQEGIAQYTNDRWQIITTTDPESIISFTFDKSGNLYYLNKYGLYMNSKGKSVLIHPGNAEIYMNHLATKMVIDREGTAWITSISGVWSIKNGVLKRFQQKDGLTNEATIDVFEDNYNNLWISGNGTGLYKHSEGPFSKINDPLLANSKTISSIGQQGKNLIVASSFSGFTSLDILQKTAKEFRPSKLLNWQNSVFVDRQGNVITNNAEEIYLYANNKTRKSNFPQPFSNTQWYQIGSKYFLIGNNRLFNWTLDTFQPILASMKINAIGGTNSTNPILIATDSSLFTYDFLKEELKSVSTLEHLQVTTLLSDDNNYYIGTDDRGLIIINIKNKTTYILSPAEGLSCAYVYSLLKDKDGQIWIGTGCGIDRLTWTGLNKYQLKNYGASDGIAGIECNANAAFQDSLGYIWFGTTQGLFQYEAKKETQNHVIPKVNITDLELFSRSVRGRKNAESLLPFSKLPYNPTFENDENTLSFSFSATCLSAPNKIKYKYQLIGVDDRLIETKQKTVTYSHLKPGDYTFIVYASDEEGHWHENAASYHFNIKALFYQTWWFKTLAAVSLLTVSIFTFNYYNNRKETIRRKELQMREKAQDQVRQRTAEDFHDEMGNKITRINLLTLMAERKAKDDPKMQATLQQIRQNTQSLYQGTKDIIWALQAESKYLNEAILRIQQNAIALLNESEIALIIEDQPGIKENKIMPNDYGRNLILIFKEGINNAIKYAQANTITLRFYEDLDNSIVLEIEDNGHGFDASEASSGNGLKNMEKRAQAIKAKLSINSRLGVGTLLRIRMFNYSFETNETFET